MCDPQRKCDNPTYTQQPSPADGDQMYVRVGDRLIFDFEKMACCCGTPTGLHPDAKDNPPTELSEKGISAGKWREWMAQLDEAQALGRSIGELAALYFFPGCGLQYVLCCLFCPISMDHSLTCLPWCMGDWYKALRTWQETVNDQLNSLGMHAKLVTYKPYWNAPRSKLYEQRVCRKNHKYEMSFLVISLTYQESVILKEESWNHGVPCTCFLGCQGRSI